MASLPNIRTLAGWLLFAAAISGVLYAFTGSAPAAHATNHTMFVNDPGDASDADPGDGTCATADGVCTLRAAIEEANAASGSNVIHFDLPSGVSTIQTSGNLRVEDTSGSLTIGDATSPRSYTLQGQGSGTALFLISSHNVVRHLIIQGFGDGVMIEGDDNRIENSTIQNNTSVGIYMFGNGNEVDDMLVEANSSTGINIGGDYNRVRETSVTGNSGVGIVIASGSHTIQSAYIQANQGGGLHLFRVAQNNIQDNTIITNSSFGVYLQQATNNTIRDNDISDHPLGVHIQQSHNNTIQGNSITARFVDNTIGVLIEDSEDNTIGDSVSRVYVGQTCTDGCNVIRGHDLFNIKISGGRNNDVLRNFIGVGDNGYTDGRENGTGIYVTNSSEFDIDFNLLGGNRRAIRLEAVYNGFVIGNAIGINPYNEEVPNSLGIYIKNSEDVEVRGNFISANTSHGIMIVGETESIIIIRNHIGTGYETPEPHGNGRNGIFISGRGVRVVIIFENVIVANETGVWIQRSDWNFIYDNQIGNMDGEAIPNQQGIAIFLANSNRIGESSGGQITGNVISGNEREGIELNRAHDTIVKGNMIGTTADGNSPLPNGDGIVLKGDANYNFIGHMDCPVDCGNTIAFNDGDGVRVEEDDAVQNYIVGNRIHDNGRLGINLGTDMVTPNDSDDSDAGPNHLLNFPEIKNASHSNGELEIEAAIVVNPYTNYSVDVFLSPACSSVGHGQGQTYVGTVDFGLVASSRTLTRTLLLPDRDYGGQVAVTATVFSHATGTSEFSECFMVEIPRPLTRQSPEEGSLARETCVAVVRNDRTFVRVGPGFNRGVFTTVEAETELTPIGQLTVDDVLWYEIDKSQIPNGESANSLWVSEQDVAVSTACDLPEAEAPPVIVPIIPTLTPAPVVTIQSPPSDDGPPPPAVQCFNVSVTKSESGGSNLGSVAVTTPSNCPTGSGFTAGTSVTISATENIPGTFTGWSGSCPGLSSPNKNHTFTINGSCSATGHFALN